MLPGVRLNLAKTGVSTSLGVPGATVNMRKGKKVFTVGLPGTGLSFRTSAANHPPPTRPSGIPQVAPTKAAENAFSLVTRFVLWTFGLLILALAAVVLLSHG